MFLYIDPGTGSMLFTILIGLFTTLYFFARKFIVYLKFRLSGGKGEAADTGKIPFVIFSDNKQYWTVFKPICDEFEKRKIPLVYWTASDQDPALNTEYQYVERRFIGEGNKAFARLNTMNACVCLATTPGLDVLQWKRSKATDWYVHILHAAGTSAAGYRMFSLDFYDAVLLTGDFQIEEIRELERKRDLPAKELKVLGCTYMDELWKKVCAQKEGAANLHMKEDASVESDALTTADSQSMADTHTAAGSQSTADTHTAAGSQPADDTDMTLGSQPETAARQMTVLLAPSWGESGILCKYGEKILEPLVQTGFQLIIRPHPQSFVSDKEVIEKLQAKYPNSDQIAWDSNPDNFDSLNRSDILISDFSSVIFDYSLVFNKPVIYAENVFIKDPYDAAWLDEEMWKFRVLPSIGLPLREEDFPRMKEVILHAVENQELSSGREQARKEAWAHIGESAALITDYLIESQARIASSAD